MKEILKSTDGFSTMSFDELVLVNGGSNLVIMTGDGTYQESKEEKQKREEQEKQNEQFKMYICSSGASSGSAKA